MGFDQSERVQGPIYIIMYISKNFASQRQIATGVILHTLLTSFVPRYVRKLTTLKDIFNAILSQNWLHSKGTYL